MRLLVVFLLLLWQQQCAGTNSNGHIAAISWEAARAAAKAAYEHNLKLAGLIGHAAPAVLSRLPGQHANQEQPGPAHGNNPSGVLEAPGSVQTPAVGSHATQEVPADPESARLQQGSCSAPGTCVLDAQHAPSPDPLASKRAAAIATKAAAKAASSQRDDTATAAPAALTGDKQAPAAWEWGWLVTHVACFLLGWFYRGRNVPRTAVTGSGDSVQQCETEQQRGEAGHSSSSDRSQRYAEEAAEPAGELCHHAVTTKLHHDQPSHHKQHLQHNNRGPTLCEPHIGHVLSVADVDAAAEVQAVPGSASRQSDADGDFMCTHSGMAELEEEGPAQLQQLFSSRHTHRGPGPSRRKGVPLYHRSRRPGSVRHGLSGKEALNALGQQQAQELEQGQQEQLAARSAGSVVCLQTPQHGQQPLQVVITAGPETLHTLVVPAMRVVQQLASGVHSLSVMSSAVVHHAQQLSTGVTNLTSRLDSLLGWAKKQEQRNQLAAQQALGQHAGQLGLSLLLVALGVTALRVGRVWEVHQVCHGRSQEYTGSWQQRLTGTRHVTSIWLYTSCCAQQLGLYAAGLAILYWLAKASWVALLVNSTRGRANQTSKAWQLDLLVFKGVLCAGAGAHIVHSLGAAWVPWLFLWWLWCGMQVMLQTRMLHIAVRSLLVFTVSLMLPLAMAVVPFHSGAVVLQGWLMEVLPVLGRLPNLKQLVPAW